MADPIEITTRRGNTLRLSYLAGERQFPRYELRFHDTRRGEEWAEEIHPEKATDLVEWIGYPQEGSELRQRLATAESALTEADHLADALSAELDSVRDNVRTLVDDLAGAWWLRAAEAYKNLAAWLVSR